MAIANSGLQRKIVLGPKAAAKWLNISARSLDYYLADGRLPYRRVGHHLVFHRSELREFRSKYLRRERSMTLLQIAKKYGKPKNTVRYHFVIKRNVRPTGMRNGATTFDRKSVEVVARFEGWTPV